MKVEERTDVQTGHEAADWHSLVPRLLTDHGSRRVAEVGVWKGELSRRILACSQIEHLTLVDPWEVVYGKSEDGRHFVFGPGLNQSEMTDAFMEVHALAKIHRDRVTILRLPSTGGASIIPDGSLDAVIIDALHTYHACKEDILAWWPKLRPGGLMIGDDMSEWFPGVQIAVEEVFGAKYKALGQTWWIIKEGA